MSAIAAKKPLIFAYNEMTKFNKAFTVITMILLSHLSQEAFAFRTTFDLGSYEATNNAKTKEGKNYDSKVGVYLTKNHSATMKKCFDIITKPSNEEFKIVLLISESGTVSNLALRPESNISLCFSNTLKKEIFPAPPRDNYWVQIIMRTK